MILQTQNVIEEKYILIYCEQCVEDFEEMELVNIELPYSFLLISTIEMLCVFFGPHQLYLYFFDETYMVMKWETFYKYIENVH